jgi:transketolase
VIPGLITLRPADANEVVEAWRVIAGFRHEPVALILTRQAAPTPDRPKYAPAGGLRRGAYILADDDDGRPQVLLLPRNFTATRPDARLAGVSTHLPPLRSSRG